MECYKFIAWSDIHHDENGAKCITINDTVALETAIFNRAREWGADFTLFPGDRYLKREPHDEVKVRADRVIEENVHTGKIPHYHLIGNHDWVDATMRWHTSESLKSYNNVVVMDESKTYPFKNIRIHALPADFRMDKSAYEIDLDCFNLFTFHDSLRGCFFDEDHVRSSDGGLDPSLIDLPEFDLVLAGDIHIRQVLNLNNTKGRYLGSAIQRNKADANVERGWTEYTITRKTPGSTWEIEERFQPIRNFFTKVSFDVTAATAITDLTIPDDQVVDQLVEVRLYGDKSDVDRLADDDYWNKLSRQLNARRVDVLRGYSAQRYESVCDLEKDGSPEDDVERYIDSNFSCIGSLSKVAIIEKVIELKKS
jgi:DNA repair exonuclease SbcCD nuclease subunit